MKVWDVIVLTEDRYFEPNEITPYKQQTIDEDNFVTKALQAQGLRVKRLPWSDPTFDWSTTKLALIRSTWDYFHRFDEFSKWLTEITQKTILVNSQQLVNWNIDKHYLLDLKQAGINIPPTQIIEAKTKTTLQDTFDQCGWPEAILKPCIAGTARHTYRINKDNLGEFEITFQELISNESMMLQEFQHYIQSKGELSLMVFNGTYTHAVLKQAKPGDFRVQDSFGGSARIYTPSPEAIAFAEHVMNQCPEVPMYGRVDVMLDNNNQKCVAEVEIIEPELWFRFNPQAADLLAESITRKHFKT